MLNEYAPFILYGLMVVLVGVGAIAFSSFVGPRRTYSRAKFDPY